MEFWISALITVITLAVNIFFTYLIKPMTSKRDEIRKRLFDICTEFLIYLTDVMSKDDFEHVPSNIRNYSLKIHLCFKKGTAPEPVKEVLEKLFSEARRRKTINNEDKEALEAWKKSFREAIKSFRLAIAKYVGVF